MDRRRFVQITGAAAALATGPRLARAAAYPDRPIKVIVPFLPGSTPDLWARKLGDALLPRLGQPWVVENAPGAGGTIGASTLKRATPDGYTLGLFANTQAITAHTFRQPPYELAGDFVAISMLSGTPSLLTVPAASPIRTAADLVAALKARPGELSYGSGGNGSIAHLGIEQLLKLTGTRAQHIPYKGATELVASQLSGETQFGMPIFGTALSFVKDRRLRALAITSDARSPFLPEVPTLAEALPPGFVLNSWSGVFAPARTPPAIVGALFEQIVAVLRSGALDELAKTLGSDVTPSATRAQFQAFVASEDQRFANLIKNIGFKVDGR